MENKLASLLVVSWARYLMRLPHFYVEDRWPSFPKRGLVAERASDHNNKMQIRNYLLWRPPNKEKSQNTTLLQFAIETSMNACILRVHSYVNVLILTGCQSCFLV